jgi:hypothetical protein
MSEQTREALEAQCANQGISLPDDLVAAALELHARFRHDLDELRRLPLAFVDAVEPANVIAWIENGGRSTPDDG